MLQQPVVGVPSPSGHSQNRTRLSSALLTLLSTDCAVSTAIIRQQQGTLRFIDKSLAVRRSCTKHASIETAPVQSDLHQC